MTSLHNFSNHLQSITKEQWDNLFVLVDQLHHSKINNGVKSIETHQLLFDAIETIISLGLLVKFDYTKCKLVDQVLESNNYNDLDTLDVCKILTVIIRKDKFVFNTIQTYFEMGVWTKLLERLKYLHQ